MQKPPTESICFSFFVCVYLLLPFRLVTLASRTVREHGTTSQMSKMAHVMMSRHQFKVKIERDNRNFSGLPTRFKEPWTWLSRSPKWSKTPDATKKETDGVFCQNLNPPNAKSSMVPTTSFKSKIKKFPFLSKERCQSDRQRGGRKDGDQKQAHEL